MKNTIKFAIMCLILTTMTYTSPAYADKQPLMEIALNNLERAEKSLEKAAWNKGSHRAKALHHVRKAIKEVRKGMEFADDKR